MSIDLSKMPKLGFGLMRLPKLEDGSIDVAQTSEMVDLFLEAGGTYFDTAFVYDNGEGIEEKDIDNIWDRYYKVDKEHKRHQLGSGIGLSLSRQLLIAHDINYGVESKVGEYSKFYFDLNSL